MLYNKTAMENINFKVKSISCDMKISDYMKSKLGFSTSLITKVKFGGVKLNGEVVTMRARVKEGDTVSVTFPIEESKNVAPINIPLDIIYEDGHILAVNKPKNMPTHPSRGNHLPTLANAVAFYLGEPFVFRSVNRLDRGTSGIVIIAKNPYAAAKLGRSMKERKFTKKYIAEVCGVPSPEEGRIEAPIARECEGNIKRVVRDDGKAAITEYKVIEKLESGNSVCEIRLLTGRTHQIRVHMAYIGNPLFGDFLYGDEAEDGYRLTCHEISFPHPESGETVTLRIEDKNKID
jgi:23S rRNA pseudouridine1911/1915/1917 synthase